MEAVKAVPRITARMNRETESAPEERRALPAIITKTTPPSMKTSMRAMGTEAPAIDRFTQ